MTWIIGSPTLFGHAILVSDICVTFQNTAGSVEYRGCLQKIYCVGKSQIAGFSGSVNIGLKILEELTYESMKLSDNQDWIMDAIANTWFTRVARRIFNASEDAEKRGGCSIIIASAHPKKNMGDVPWPITTIHIFKSPDFGPEKFEPGTISSIGSGSQIDVYQNEIKSVVDRFEYQQSVIGGPISGGLTFFGD